MRPRLRTAPVVLLTLVATTTAAAQGVTLEIRNDFVRAYHNRATMDVSYRVVGSQTTAHSVANDGEVHISGTARLADGGEDVGFATVAEIMHADRYEGAGGLLRWIDQQRKDGQPIRMQGVWRLWGEHGAGSFRQGTYAAPGTWKPATNPVHVFELHPVTRLLRGSDTVSFLGDFRALPGFPDAESVQRSRAAFGYYEKMKCTIQPGPQTTRISGTAHRYNFLGFEARLKGDRVPTDDGDGFFATADVFDPEGRGMTGGQPLARNVRLVFTGGTPPADSVRAGPAIQRVKLVGFARLNLAPVEAAIRAGQTVQGACPYEIVVTWLGPN